MKNNHTQFKINVAKAAKKAAKEAEMAEDFQLDLKEGRKRLAALRAKAAAQEKKAKREAQARAHGWGPEPRAKKVAKKVAKKKVPKIWVEWKR
jgi:hypothetical protein